MPMITIDEMKNLAMLARIEMSDEEMESMAHDFDSILAYVDQINKVVVDEVSEKPLQVNSTHTDANPYPAGTFSDKLIAGAPDAQDGFYKVPKIL